MADNSKTMENLFEQQNRETLLEFNRSVSGVTMFQERKSSSLSLLNKFRLEGDSGFCDVILEVEDIQLTTHRCVLAANSQFFYAMFSSGMRESNQKLLSLQSVDFDSMSLILDYFYTREIVINDDNVLELLNASSFLLVTPVKNACIQLLSKLLSSENCFSILQVAEQFDASDLAKMANNFIKTNFLIVVNNEEFVSVSRNHLLTWVASDDIQVLKEEEIYQAVLKWVRHDEVNRVSVLPELLENLRKGSLPKGFLESEMTKEPLLVAASCEVEPAKKRIKTTKRKGKCDSAGKSEPLGLRPSTVLRNVLIGIGTDNCRKAFCYDLDKKETLILSELSLLQCNPQVAFVGRSLYLVGGLNNEDDPVQNVCALCFHDAKNLRMQMDWREKRPCKVARLAASLVELNGLLYYIGGYQIGSGGCNIVECYNPEIDEWNYCGRLNTSRCKSGCVVAKGHIYVIGGERLLGKYTSESVLSSVERYDTERDSWSYVAPMKEARSKPGCVYWNNKIYVIGGIVSTSVPTTSCEVYSPVTDEWQAIANLPYPYSGDNNVIIIKNQVTVPLRHETANFSCEAVNYSMRSNVWRKMKHLGPSDKVVTFTLCATQLPTMILQRLPRVLCLPDFFEELKDSDEDPDDFWGGSDDSSSICGWHSVRDSEDFDMEPSDGDAY